MTQFMLNVVEISISMAAVIAVILILAQIIGRKFTAKSRYIIWLIVLARLAVPFDTGLIPSLFEFDISDESESVQTAANMPEYYTAVTEYAAADIIETVSELTYTNAYSEYSDDISAAVIESPLGGSDFSYDIILKALTYVYIIGAVIFFIWKMTACFAYTEVIRRSRLDVSDEVYGIYNSICNDMNITKKPEIFVSSYIRSPLLYGFFKPCVVLSDELTDTAALSAVLAHELTHYLRRDLWLKLISLIAVSLHWFNPLVHICAKKFEFEMELSCDERVLSGFDDESRVAYGIVVLDIVKRCEKASGSLTTHFNTGSSVLKRRIVNIVDTTEKSKGRIIMISVLVVCIFMGSAFAFTLGNGKNNGEKIELSDSGTTSEASDEEVKIIVQSEASEASEESEEIKETEEINVSLVAESVQESEKNVISINSLARWEDIAGYTYESYRGFLTALLESGEYAPYGTGAGYGEAFLETMKNVKFGDYTVTPQDFNGDRTIILDVEVLGSDVELFPVGKNRYLISDGFIPMTIAPLDKETGGYNFNDTPAQNALKLWFGCCRIYQFPKFGELPSAETYNIQNEENNSVIEQYYMTDIGEYILFTYGGDSGLSAEEMRYYSQKCFGVDYTKYYDIIFEENGLYYVGGHGGERWSMTALGETQKNNEITVTVQFYADYSKLVKSHLIEYSFTLLEDGTLVFNGSEFIEKSSLRPAHISV